MLQAATLRNVRKSAISMILLTSMVLASASTQAQARLTLSGIDTLPSTHTRKATLPELYEMFFIFAVHVEEKSDEDEALGKDRSFYRQHLQKNSGLTADEYVLVLDSAKTFAAVDAEVETQVRQLLDANARTLSHGNVGSIDFASVAQNNKQVSDLFAKRTSSLNAEIANIRHSLGEDRANSLNAFLLNKYAVHGTHPMPAMPPDAVPPGQHQPSSSTTYSRPPSDSRLRPPRHRQIRRSP